MILLTQRQRAFSSWGLYCSDCHPPADNWPPTLYLIGWREIKGVKNVKSNGYFSGVEISLSSCALGFVYLCCYTICSSTLGLLLTAAHQRSGTVTTLLDCLSPHTGKNLLFCYQPAPNCNWISSFSIFVLFSRSTFFLYVLQFAQKIIVLCLCTWGSGIKDIDSYWWGALVVWEVCSEKESLSQLLRSFWYYYTEY